MIFAILIATTVALTSLLILKLKTKKYLALIQKIQAQNDESRAKLETALQRTESLAKYEKIADVEEAAKEILRQADESGRAIEQQAKEKAEKFSLESSNAYRTASEKASNITSDAKKYADTLTEAARVREMESKTNAEQKIHDAQKQADIIITEANQKADAIAGDALQAMNKANSYEKTVKAMKNIIEGYGDKYLIPTHTLLDHLADEYSHTAAGDELKTARTKTRNMIKNKTAAECDYVEEYRKQTAIEFVLDAFNGKVDTVLASVKQDNYGTLEQKIKDAYETVNHNGSAFRNARISQAYLSARMSELKLACTVQAIKERDREEQRQIREQMREEEKAAREIERALKEAEKEEQTIAKAMEKVNREIASANEEQRIKYEAKLADLQIQLVEAEEKNKRALSMAQQTKRGHVYVISNIGSFGDNVIKIGMTRRLDPQDRVDELGDASVPFDFDVHAMILSEDAPALEKQLHHQFALTQVNRVNPRKEFFKLGIADIKAAVEKIGIQVHWTMVAEAREFKESNIVKATNNGKAA